MNTLQWASFAFTCGIAAGQYIPRLVNWLMDRHEKKVYIKMKIEEYKKSKESEDMEDAQH